MSIREAFDRIRWQTFGAWLELNCLDDFPNEDALTDLLSFLDMLRYFPSKECFVDL